VGDQSCESHRLFKHGKVLKQKRGDAESLVLIGDGKGNLDVVDAIVTVGEIPNNILTQAIGRTFRPRADRDNSRPMLMVKVFTGE
jgi:hypothetical protein